MKINVHKANTRGVANLGWLHSHHTYSFAHYYDKNRMGFRNLRVLNDDVVDPSMGFETHPHENMEIVSIPLRGSLRHKDSMGNQHIIEAGEIQIMSAGTGVTHSEFNNSNEEAVNFLQIWVLPKERDIQPRYEQKRFEKNARNNKFQLVVSPDGEAESIAINQDAYFSLGNVAEGKTLEYTVRKNGNGLYVFVISGSVRLGELLLEERDGVEISELTELQLCANSDSEVLCIEV